MPRIFPESNCWSGSSQPRLIPDVSAKRYSLPFFLVFVSGFFFFGKTEIPVTTLPDPLVCVDGSRVNTEADWYNKRRPELLQLFENNIYGKSCSAPDSVTVRIESSKELFSGTAILREIVLTAYVNDTFLAMHLLEIRPKHNKGKLVYFAGLNFNGNQAVMYDKSIRITDKWIKNNESKGIVDNHATEAARGVDASQWPVKDIIDHGFGLITCHNADIDVDAPGDTNGIQAMFRSPRDSAGWGSVAAWAWGLSRLLDYAMMQGSDSCAVQVIAIGHSRLGKAALWAAAGDPRFAAVISNNSGCAGAAIFRDKEGEKITDINNRFPHWFNDNFKKFNGHEDSLPVDQHELLALIAPRPLYVTSASLDQWADPENEFLAVTGALPVYRLLGGQDVPALSTPLVNTPQIGLVSYHVREGKHGLTSWDWQHFFVFAQKFVAPS